MVFLPTIRWVQDRVQSLTSASDEGNVCGQLDVPLLAAIACIHIFVQHNLTGYEREGGPATYYSEGGCEGGGAIAYHTISYACSPADYHARTHLHSYPKPDLQTIMS